MTQSGRDRDEPEKRRRAFSQATERQMQVNAREDQVIDQTIDDSSLSTLPAGQARELPVRVVQQIGENMKRHAGNVRRQVLIKIEMPGDDPENAAE
jgi:hypothetical protein